MLDNINLLIMTVDTADIVHMWMLQVTAQTEQGNAPPRNAPSSSGIRVYRISQSIVACNSTSA